MKEHAEGPMAKELSQISNPERLALELAFFASPCAPAAWRSERGLPGFTFWLCQSFLHGKEAELAGVSSGLRWSALTPGPGT